jgi:serine/threonine-protein kinase ULK/ATG1
MAEQQSTSRRTKPASDDAVGNFVIDGEIGKGSFAQVYSGRHKVSSIPPLLFGPSWEAAAPAE